MKDRWKPGMRYQIKNKKFDEEFVYVGQFYSFTKEKEFDGYQKDYDITYTSKPITIYMFKRVNMRFIGKLSESKFLPTFVNIGGVNLIQSKVHMTFFTEDELSSASIEELDFSSCHYEECNIKTDIESDLEKAREEINNIIFGKHLRRDGMRTFLMYIMFGSAYEDIPFDFTPEQKRFFALMMKKPVLVEE